MASNRPTASTTPIEVDVDSPGAKGPCRPSLHHGAQECIPLTLDMFLNAIQPLIAKVGTVEDRIGQVEAAFTTVSPRSGSPAAQPTAHNLAILNPKSSKSSWDPNNH